MMKKGWELQLYIHGYLIMPSTRYTLKVRNITHILPSIRHTLKGRNVTPIGTPIYRKTTYIYDVFNVAISLLSE